jgi:hypothetical protein
METIQNVNARVQKTNVVTGPAQLAGWFALAVFVAWMLAFVGGILSSSVFPGAADQFIPAKIQANVFLASLNWFTQIALGTALVAFALPFSDFLIKPMNTLVRLALIGGLLGGVFFIAAGSGGQENIFQSVFPSPEQNITVAQAIGLPDLTVINAANDLVSGGMRSTGSYLVGWSMVLWGIAALKTRKVPTVLSWIQIVTGILFTLTVWIGPITGPFSFIGMLIWSLWLGIFLLRVKRPNEF